jgi:hypothetical protein
MYRVPEVVSEASEMLRSSSPHVLVMSEAVGRHVIVMVTSDGMACSFLIELALLGVLNEGHGSLGGLHWQSRSFLRTFYLSNATPQPSGLLTRPTF